jgi:hypothetical protein
MVLLLTVLSGIAWTIVYIDSLRVGPVERLPAEPYGNGTEKDRG